MEWRGYRFPSKQSEQSGRLRHCRSSRALGCKWDWQPAPTLGAKQPWKETGKHTLPPGSQKRKRKKRRKKAAWVNMKVTLSHPTARTNTTISVTFGDTNTRTSEKTKITSTIVVEHVRAPRSCDAIKGWNVSALQHKNETTCTLTSSQHATLLLNSTSLLPLEHKNTHTHSQTPYVGLL